MIESGHADARVVGGGEKGIAGTEAGAHDAETAIALLLEPVEATTRVNHALAAGVERAADIGGDGVVGAAGLRGHANVVIGHAQPQHGNAQSD